MLPLLEQVAPLAQNTVSPHAGLVSSKHEKGVLPYMYGFGYFVFRCS